MAKTVAVGCCGSILDTPLTDEHVLALADAFSALGDPVRLKLLSLLASADAGEVCVCDLVAPVGKTQGTVSHHLKILSEAGLVRGVRRGKWVWYAVVNERLAELEGALTPRVVKVGASATDTTGLADSDAATQSQAFTR